jgi:hypothetical protein
MLFIRTGQQEPGSNYRNYIFPYRIGQTRKLFERQGFTWEARGSATLESNLADEYATNAVKQKLIRLGNSIRAQKLPVLALIVAQSEDDVLDVFIKEVYSNDPYVWLSFTKTLSSAFCLPVRL